MEFESNDLMCKWLLVACLIRQALKAAINHFLPWGTHISGTRNLASVH